MAWTLPRLLRRLGAALVHTQYALPLRCPCPAVVTIHDLSFERDSAAMGRRDRMVFRRVVPRAREAAARVLTVSERSKRDLVELYGVPPGADRRDPERRRSRVPAGRRGDGTRRLRARRRGDPAAQEPARRARRGARRPGSQLVVVGPDEGRGARSGAARGGAHGSRATSRSSGSPSCTAAPPASSSRPATRGSVCRSSRRWRAGRPSSSSPDPALVEVVGRRRRRRRGGRARRRDPRARSQRRDRLRAAGLERARALLAGARRRRRRCAVYVEALGTMSVSAVVVSHGHAGELERSLPALAAAGRRARRRREPPGLASRRAPDGARVIENAAAASARGERQPRHRGDDRRVRPHREPGRRPRARRGRGARRVRR